ncbi:Collagen alpha-5VI chain [Hondaea fermentalgiana]|uniref:Collagen alpha-5VI chain n=1 Tax=Hondaea fermentalgiana TaxID=2315210 RepID=A0A2R5GYK6_9STRA|nr:Collagen alpha-5VI chain [Hondaea fermentalgiana]|eukprot:GBG34898.1 Collagen alpha-5VI chain [Hondaea fermentalgiana]
MTGCGAGVAASEPESYKLEMSEAAPRQLGTRTQLHRVPWAILHMAIALVLCSHIVSAVDCSAMQECNPKSRRILFILDGSLSINQTHFDMEMMDFVINTYCGFRNTAGGVKYEAGVITFNQYIETRIPFTEFTPDEFETAINTYVRYQTPLRCCTTHAEAAILAKEMFKARGLNDGYENIAFFVTDGQPFINYKFGEYSVADDSRSRQFYDDRGLSLSGWTQNKKGQRDEMRVSYATQKVPKKMRDLKNLGIRVFFIGVPHNDPDKNVNIDYFNGKLTNDEICYTNEDVTPSQTSCGTLSYSPLVSKPVDDHAFGVETWDMQPLVDKALDKICLDWSDPGAGCFDVKRDVMILVDTSESIDPARFSDEMLTIIKGVGDQVGYGAGSRIGVATFGSEGNTVIRVPIKEFGGSGKFATAVDNNLADITLECCTNLAEAFEMLQGYLRANYRQGQDKLVLVLTDGTPFQNFGTGPYMWRSSESSWRLNRCQYVTETVPMAAARLRADGVRIALVGVPNVDNRAPMEDYFTGALKGSQCCVNPDTNAACLINSDSEWCSGSYDAGGTVECETYTERSVVSPGSYNIFTVSSWDVAAALDSIGSMLCYTNAYPTPPPTDFVPTRRPTEAGADTGEDTRSLLPVDVLIMFDHAETTTAQEDACVATFGLESCQQQLFNFANKVRKALEYNSAIFSMALVSTSCAWDKTLGGSVKWKETERRIRRLIRAGRDTTRAGTQCLAPGFRRARKHILNDRKDPLRPVAVILLTHKDATSSDTSAARSKAAALRDDTAAVVYAATVDPDDSDHLSDLAKLTGASSRVYSALSGNGIYSMLQDFLASVEV